jgi:hypothetical protein
MILERSIDIAEALVLLEPPRESAFAIHLHSFSVSCKKLME